MAAQNGKRRPKIRPTWYYVMGSIVVLLGILWKDRENGENTANNDNQECAIIMAQSAIPNAGWGMFTLQDIPKGDAANFGEAVIQMHDLLVEYGADLDLLLDRYVWSPENGGGSFESPISINHVYSMMPGIGMLANGHPNLVNVASTLTYLDNAGVSRQHSPGAGASTHFHNVLWISRRSLKPGDEILVSYGAKYDRKIAYSHHAAPKRSIQELRQNGMCLDNIRPDTSTIVDAGRGAFATRDLRKNTIIAPAPLLVIPDRNALTTRRLVHPNSREEIKGKQLLLNYCFGHTNSSLLFYPYSPVVNFINHDSKNYNARLQWSQSPLHSGKEWLDWSIERAKSMSVRRTGLLLEIVATRDIKQGEEVLIDYGRNWEQAWNQHKASWKAVHDENYVYPSDLQVNQIIDVDTALPSNILTACHHHYGERAAEAANGELSVPWKQTQLAMKTLHPCKLISREGDSYTAEIFNLGGLADQIPLNERHVVTNMPRHAILFRDMPYTSDQHLPNSFRHAIGIPDSIFPQQWLDLQ